MAYCTFTFGPIRFFALPAWYSNPRFICVYKLVGFDGSISAFAIVVLACEQATDTKKQGRLKNQYLFHLLVII
jgi:hypothetical protein